MSEDERVFSSNIIRGQKSLRNNLYDLLNVESAKPSTVNNEKEYKCDFQPKNDKYYVPKKRNKLKVKTVRDIRTLLEKDVYSYLQNDLEKQQNFLLKKITCGSWRNLHTKTVAKNIMKSENPITRSSWQMLMNLNPEDHAHNFQYILWNGIQIRINGSKGGKNKYIFNYDLANKKKLKQNNYCNQKRVSNKKKGLLQNSLKINFKPGPLVKKKFLDVSHQKYNVGSTELVHLPKPGLDIQPKYGVVIEPSISNLLQNIRDIDGTISEKWAAFSVSVLGTLKESTAVQNNTESSITFDLKYNSNQSRMLMRHDFDTLRNNTFNDCKYLQSSSKNEAADIASEVKIIMTNILNSVEISLEQNNMYSGEDELRETSNIDSTNVITNTHLKDKVKKNTELGRLDVTVIRLPDGIQEDRIKCQKSYCSLGCICSSLECAYNLKQHCGRVECMFECKCDFSKYKLSNSFSELIPGLINLKSEINLKLTKEEQKFHQTVVVTGEKNIFLKSEKRNWKATKRYADFYSNLCLKTESKTKRVLSVVDVKLNCENIEPWCMVHNLYKCFCKGKFTQRSLPDKVPELTGVNEITTHQIATLNDEINNKNIGINSRNRIRPSTGLSRNSMDSEGSNLIDLELLNTCARVKPYRGRKYNESYYLNANKKIVEMEKNDHKLHRRMITLINMEDKKCKETQNDDNCVLLKPDVLIESNDFEKQQTFTKKNENSDPNFIISQSPKEDSLQVHDLLVESSSPIEESSHNNNSIIGDVAKRLSNKSKLISWLESSYKQYKQRLDQGIIKTSLEPPKDKKVALYPWDFILSRYRERKNLFLISKQKPFRIFMAVTVKNSFFENCININDIRLADLHKYPVTVKNLLTNATDLKDNFCILCGLPCCWELIGSVTKVSDQQCSDSKSDHHNESDLENYAVSEITIQEYDVCTSENSTKNSMVGEFTIQKSVITPDADCSKWFVMTVENDFSEIQFYQRGFFVKYESIIKAINVARMSGKTVRLSSQKCIDASSGPQFGLYAIPNVNEYCVFVGPYEKEEPLGIETVKTTSFVEKTARTRGVWITTTKTENSKVIDNPLSFMPPISLPHCKFVSLENERNLNIAGETSIEHLPNIQVKKSSPQSVLSPKSSSIEKPKIIKPIRIQKKNGFYHLAPQNFLKSQKHPVGAKVLLPQGCMPKSQLNTTFTSSNSLLTTSVTRSLTSDMSSQLLLMNVENKRPIAEIAPQIKIVEANSESFGALAPKKLESMFVLKPDEINKRLMKNQEKKEKSTYSSPDLNVNQDIENFLATSKICTLQNSDVLIISDEEESSSNTGNEQNSNNLKNVWIQCTNIENLGWIRGIKNSDNNLSFEFPGFKYTSFYTEEDAFLKINQVLSRKVYVPISLNLQWEVIENENELKTDRRLNPEDLGSDFVLTRRGLRHKRDLMANIKTILRTDIRKESNEATLPLLSSSSSSSETDIDNATELLMELEERSTSLEDKCQQLINEFKQVSDSQREQMINILKKV